MGDGEYEYDVALSFAGENRPVAENLAKLLEAGGISVFYDDWKKSDLWGRDLFQHLDEVYSEKARFCVMFISAAYAAKAWTNHELKSAQERAFRKNDTYILPVRLDDTEIPGIRTTLGYVDLRTDSIEEVARLVIEKISVAKLGGVSGQTAKDSINTHDPKPPLQSPTRTGKLRVKKQFTDQERDDFLESAFEIIANFFQETLAGLPSENPSFSGKFRRLNANHFTAVVYQGGKNVAQCGIRLGGRSSGFDNQIVYSSEPHATNSMNEGVRVADDDAEMFLKASGISSMTRSQQKDRLTPSDAAELFWEILTRPLQ